jgi:hypothetical protein
LTIDPAVSWILALGLALMFGIGAAHKAKDWPRFQAVLQNFGLLPRPAVPAVGAIVIAAEIAAAAMLTLPTARPTGAVVGVALLAIYGAALVINLFKGHTRIDCGCLGFGRHDRIGWGTVLRNAILVALAGAVALPDSPRELVAVDALTIAGGVAALTLLAAAVATLGSLPRRSGSTQ